MVLQVYLVFVLLDCVIGKVYIELGILGVQKVVYRVRDIGWLFKYGVSDDVDFEIDFFIKEFNVMFGSVIDKIIL